MTHRSGIGVLWGHLGNDDIGHNHIGHTKHHIGYKACHVFVRLVNQGGQCAPHMHSGVAMIWCVGWDTKKSKMACKLTREANASPSLNDVFMSEVCVSYSRTYNRCYYYTVITIITDKYAGRTAATA